MRQPKVFIVTINHNGEKDTIEFIESLRGSSYTNYSLIIVDNSSNAQSTTTLFDYVTQVGEVYRATENDLDGKKLAEASISFITAENRGFAAANNVALRPLLSNHVSAQDYFLVINNDVVLDKHAIEHLVASYEQRLDQNIGIVAPVIYYHGTNKIWLAGGHFIKWLGMLKSYDKNKLQVTTTRTNINFLTGCAWLIRKDRLQQVGILDEAFFMYGEDLDFSLKIKEHNLELYVESKAKIWHKIGASSNGDLSSFSAYWMMFGRIRNIKKHNGPIGKYAALLVLITSRVLIFPYYLFKNKAYLAKCQVRAIRNGIASK
jgi:GT2 family glycosyltransferase